jgi:hypothetical protein
MDDLTVVRRAVERLLAGAIGPLLDLLADDVELEVADGGDPAGSHTGRPRPRNHIRRLGLDSRRTHLRHRRARGLLRHLLLASGGHHFPHVRPLSRRNCDPHLARRGRPDLRRCDRSHLRLRGQLDLRCRGTRFRQLDRGRWLTTMCGRDWLLLNASGAHPESCASYTAIAAAARGAPLPASRATAAVRRNVRQPVRALAASARGSSASHSPGLRPHQIRHPMICDSRAGCARKLWIFFNRKRLLGHRCREPPAHGTRARS